MESADIHGVSFQLICIFSLIQGFVCVFCQRVKSISVFRPEFNQGTLSPLFIRAAFVSLYTQEWKYVDHTSPVLATCSSHLHCLWRYEPHWFSCLFIADT
jgi:hypothetical protein